MVKGWHFGVVHHHKGIDGAAARGLNGVPFKRMALRTNWAGWVAQSTACCASLDEQLALIGTFPKEPCVVTDAGRRTLGWRGHLGRLFLCAVRLSGAEFKDAEQELTHFFIA